MTYLCGCYWILMTFMTRKRGIIIGLLAAIIIAAMGICGRMAVRQDREMHAALDSLLEQNRSYVPFTTDSVARRVAAYFDHPLHFWTTSNDRLRAHYALGSVYRDLHEAPAALLAWEDGIAAADTTSKNCDFATLARVYGQMADVYFRQYMPEKQLEACEHYCLYSLQSGDTLLYIQGLLQKNDAYLVMKDTSAIYRNTEFVRQWYQVRGLDAEAAQVFPTVIRLALDQHDYIKADSMMRDFERMSNLFDDEGNIKASYEFYYFNKGLYYLGVGKLDSASFQFQKLVTHEMYLDAYRGLTMLYQEKHDADSVFKYARLYEDALAQYLRFNKTVAIAQAEGMYDYSRQQQVALKKQLIVNRLSFLLACIILFGLIITLFAWLYIQKKNEENRRLLESFSQTVDRMTQIEKESKLLRDSLSDMERISNLLKEKVDECAQLRRKVEILKDKIGSSAAVVYRQKLNDMPIVKHLRSISKPHIAVETDDSKSIVHERKATDEEWASFERAVHSVYPELYNMVERNKLSMLRSKVLLLCYLRFSNNMIATLIGSTPNSVTNAKIALNQSLFKENSARTLDRNLSEL